MHAAQAVDRQAILTFLQRMAVPPAAGGGFTLCEGACHPLWQLYSNAEPLHHSRLAKRLLRRSGVRRSEHAEVSTACQAARWMCAGCYTAMATAHLLGLDTATLARRAGMVEYVRSCQVRS